MKNPEKARATFSVLKPTSCPFLGFTLESNQNNAYLHQMIGSEMDNK
jgi:hypothetical protein